MRVGFPLSVLRTNGVSQGWRSPLSSEKSGAYLHTLRLLETSYTIFSVNLDEAVGLRRSGQLNKSYLALSISPTLCKRLSTNVQLVLRAMLSHAKHFRTAPGINPLDPENFQNPKSRRSASFNNLCSRIMLTQRSQFLHKISTLVDLVEDLEKSFSGAAADLKDSLSLHPEREWEILDSSHYDLNTCLRESIVLLKCFFHALPSEQLAEFTATLQNHTVSPVPSAILPRRHVAHRRMTLLKGQ